jgi:hypothetical protein
VKYVDDKWQPADALSPNHPARVFKTARAINRMPWGAFDGTDQALLLRRSNTLLQLRQAAGEPALRRKHTERPEVVLQAES